MFKSKSKICVSLSVMMLLGVFTLASLYHNSVTDNAIAEITAISMSYDYPVATNLSQMTDEADLIVIGKYVGLDSIWNMARDPDNVKNEDSENYVEGQLYSFVIDDVLKGDTVTDTILVNHRYSETVKSIESNAKINEEGIIVKAATKSNEITLKVLDPLFIEPDLNSTYILFLLKDQDFGNYYGAIEPFVIKITDEIAVLQSNLIDKADNFVQPIDIDGSRTVEVIIDGVSIDDTISGKSFEDIKKAIISNK